MQTKSFLQIWIFLIFIATPIACKKDKPQPADYVNVTTLAGNGDGYADGNIAIAKFAGPRGIATDVQGNIYIADARNSRIRKITPTGIVSTLAGNGKYGHIDGSGNMAQFKTPESVATDIQGNVYEVEENGTYIRKITPAGDVSTLAGGDTSGFVDGSISTAKFGGLIGIATDIQGNIFVTDAGIIRKITPTGIVSTLADSGVFSGIATDPQRNIYVVEAATGLIHKITPTGIISTLAGSRSCDCQFGIATDTQGNIYEIESSPGSILHCIHKITATGVDIILAGSTYGYANGSGSSAKFTLLYGIATDTQGNIYVSEYGDNFIRKISQ